MLIADDFVFLHIPKTGGTFIQRIIREHLPRIDIGTYTHTCYSDFREDAKHLPGFYVIRNPWDWYVSWFHYSMKWGARRKSGREINAPRKAVIWEDLLRGGRADFREAVTRACDGDYDVGAAFPTLGDHSLDLYSAYVMTIAGPVLGRSDFRALRFERLRAQLRDYLRGRQGVDKYLMRAIRSEQPDRASSHGAYQAHYGAKLRRVVGNKTAWLCDRFGYRFEAQALARMRT